jgi:hypothetical protein
MCVGKQEYLVRISIALHVCAIPTKSDKYYSIHTNVKLKTKGTTPHCCLGTHIYSRGQIRSCLGSHFFFFCDSYMIIIFFLIF